MKHLYYLSAALFLLTIFASAQVPDYNLPQNWICHPMKSTDPSHGSLRLDVLLPDSSIDTTITYSPPAPNAGVDIFYIYPTIDWSIFYYNTPIAWIDTNTAKYMMRSQIGLLAQFGRVFAPYYRQATLGTYLDTGQHRVAIFDTAYSDVERAFTHYLNNYNNGNKIILVGHSQGGGHVLFLLRKLFDNNPSLRSKLLVAIPGGAANFVQKGSDRGGSLQNIPVCPPLESGYSCGCVIGWRSYKYATPLTALASWDPVVDSYFMKEGLMYQVFDSLTKEESYFDFGYDKLNVLTRYIDLNSKDSTTYVGYDNMYAARNVVQVNPAAAAFEVQNIQLPGDKRTDPMWGTNFHTWDFQIIQGDLLNILNGLISQCVNTDIRENEWPEDVISVFPNPASDVLHIQFAHSVNGNAAIYDFTGREVASAIEFHNSFLEIKISPLHQGIYFLRLNMEKRAEVFKFVVAR